LLAWAVHLLTACGAVCCLLALEASARRDWRTALLWLGLAVVIDGVDGGLARLTRARQVLPHFDGALLDNIVDYGNYVLVPAILVLGAELVPAAWSLPAAAAICLASAYQFCQTDAKTADHYFKGFPSYWNIVVLYLFALKLRPAVNLAVILGLIVLVFMPWKFVYPSRTVPWRRLTLVLTVCWGGMLAMILWQFPDAPRWLVGISLLYVAYYFAVSLTLSRRSVPGAP
jgi:phosphatidylcholine synthase